MRTPLVLLPCVILVIATACNTPGIARQATATDAPPALSTAPAAWREIPNPPAPTPTYGPIPTYAPLPEGFPRFERHPEAWVWDARRAADIARRRSTVERSVGTRPAVDGPVAPRPE